MMFDLVILGGGVAGTTAALLAVEKGLRTALVSDKPWGGVCLHEGCIPAKVCLENTFSDMASLSAFRQKTVDTLYAGLRYTLEESAVELFTGHGVYTKEKGERFTVQVGEQTLYSETLLLATGALPVTLPDTLTPEDIFSAQALPQSAVIFGGGAAGLETASYLCKMGTSVTVVEQSERLLPQADPDISQALLRGLRRRGVTVRLGTRADRTAYDAEAFICAMGRRSAPYTPADGLYVIGDALGHHCTAHAAMREAECAVRRICGETDTVDYNSIPNVVFCDPQCAWVGTTSPQAAAVSLKSVGGYLASGGDGTGLLKLFAASDGTVCGMQICGGNAAELIGIGALAVGGRLSVSTLSQTVFAHPTVSEAVRTAANILLRGGQP